MRLAPTFLLLFASLVAAPAWAHPSEANRIERLTRAIAEKPEDASLYLRRGRSYANENHLDRALADLLEAQTLGDPVLAAYDLGVVLYRMGELVPARAAFTRWLERFPDHGPALEYRARVARDLGDLPGAIADFEAYFALQESPNPGDYLSAARLLEQSEGGVEAALAMLDRGMARLGVIPQLQERAIDLERSRGGTEAAIARLASLESVLHGSPGWKIDMAELLEASARREEAIALLDEAATQLDGLRQTAARRALRARLEALRERAASAPSEKATPSPRAPSAGADTTSAVPSAR